MPKIKDIKIGYLIPEFPGQTHIFFWREMQALRDFGISVELISTRKPLAKIISHEWATKAMSDAIYLFPIRFRTILKSIFFLLTSGPKRWWRCFCAIDSSEINRLKDYLRLLALVFIGGQLAGIARDKGWHHIHVHSCADSANIALFAHLLSGIPYSMTLHGPLISYGPNQKQKWKHSSFCLVITKRLLSEINEKLCGFLPERIGIAPMGVDIKTFHRSGPYMPWDGEGPFRIFSCSRLTWLKGHGDLIYAIGLIKEQGINVRLRIAGEDHSQGGAVREGLVKLINDLHLEDNIELLGAISEEKVRSELESAHLFALASWHEELGVATMEAMAMKLPVVVTDVGGVSELVDRDISGIMVDPNNYHQLSDGILRIINNPSFAQKLGDSGYAKIKTSFNSGLSAKIIARFLKEFNLQ
jgi:colanic acid/amylovoran biosynthesis glycosyltransferase